MWKKSTKTTRWLSPRLENFFITILQLLFWVKNTNSNNKSLRKFLSSSLMERSARCEMDCENLFCVRYLLQLQLFDACCSRTEFSDFLRRCSQLKDFSRVRECTNGTAAAASGERERKGGKSLIITWTQFARDDLILSWERQQTISSSLMCSTRCCCCRAARESCSEKRRNRFSYTQELRTKCKMRKSHKSNEGKEGEKNCGASEDDRRRPTTVKSSTQKSLRRKRKMNHVFLRNFARHLPSFALLFF